MSIFFLALLFLLWAFFPTNVLTVSIAIGSYPQKINDSEFHLQFTVTGAKAATNYFRILLSPEGSHSYKARTWNGNTWYDGSDGKQYFPVVISNESTSAELRGQVPEGVSSGSYVLSIRRFTASGASAGDTITPVSVSLQMHEANESIKPVQTPTPQAEQTPLPSASPPPIPSTSPGVDQTAVLADAIEINPPTIAATPSQSPAVTNSPSGEESTSSRESHWRVFLAAFLSGLAGVVFSLYGGYLLWKNAKNWYNNSHAQL